MAERRLKLPGYSRFVRGDIAIERRRGDGEAVRDLGHPNVEISQQRLGGLGVVVGDFRRTPSLALKEFSHTRSRYLLRDGLRIR